MQGQESTKKVLWKYFSSFSSIAMGNSSVWEWFKHLENMLYVIYMDNEEHHNNLNFPVKHILCLEQKNSWNWGLRAWKWFYWNGVINGLWSWGLTLNLNFSSLRIMSSSARYERYKGNQVLFWWVHSTCWSSSAEMWANLMFCMLLYVTCFSVIVHNWLKA